MSLTGAFTSCPLYVEFFDRNTREIHAGENRMMLVDLWLFGFDMQLNEQEVTQQAEEVLNKLVSKKLRKVKGSLVDSALSDG